MAKYISDNCDNCLHYAGTKGCLVNHKWTAPFCGEYEETKTITLALTEDEARYAKFAFLSLRFLVKTDNGILNVEQAEKCLSSLISKLPEKTKEAEIYGEDYTPF